MSAVKQSVTWKTIQALHVKNGGVWKAVQKAYVKSSGVWKQFYTAVATTLSGATAAITNTSTSSGLRSAGFVVASDGSLSISPFSWITGGTPSGYYVKFSISGSNYVWNGDTLGAWLPVTSSPTASVRNSGSILEGTGTITTQVSPDASTVSSSFTTSFDVGYTGA